jgi:hypothetical protein
MNGAALAGLGAGSRIHLQVLLSDPALPAPSVAPSDGLWFEVVP